MYLGKLLEVWRSVAWLRDVAIVDEELDEENKLGDPDAAISALNERRHVLFKKHDTHGYDPANVADDA